MLREGALIDEGAAVRTRGGNHGTSGQRCRHGAALLLPPRCKSGYADAHVTEL